MFKIWKITRIFQKPKAKSNIFKSNLNKIIHIKEIVGLRDCPP